MSGAGSGISIKHLKIRPKKAKFRPACATQLNFLLGCWAATGDYTSAEKCAEAATALHDCMRATQMGAKRKSSSINYHLSRLQRVLK